MTSAYAMLAAHWMMGFVLQTMKRITSIDIHNEYLHFSAAHFTIFSATERERLHGHNFAVSAEITAAVGEDGLSADYSLFKRKLQAMCDSLDEYVLLPQLSPYLTIEEDGEYYRAVFSGQTMMFLKTDTLLLPIRNTTVEEYSYYFLEKLLADKELMQACTIEAMELRVASGPGQHGASRWQR